MRRLKLLFASGLVPVHEPLAHNPISTNHSRIKFQPTDLFYIFLRGHLFQGDVFWSGRNFRYKHNQFHEEISGNRFFFCKHWAMLTGLWPNGPNDFIIQTLPTHWKNSNRLRNKKTCQMKPKPTHHLLGQAQVGVEGTQCVCMDNRGSQKDKPRFLHP